GSVVMFGMAIIPNPFFDVAGGLAGVGRMPGWGVFSALLLGKTIKSAYVAGPGAVGFRRLGRRLGETAKGGRPRGALARGRPNDPARNGCGDRAGGGREPADGARQGAAHARRPAADRAHAGGV